jgi:hypothetical protein
MTGPEPSAFPSTTVALPLPPRHDAVRRAALPVHVRVRWWAQAADPLKVGFIDGMTGDLVAMSAILVRPIELFGRHLILAGKA